MYNVRLSLLSLFATLLLLAACAPPQPGVRPPPVAGTSEAERVSAHLERGELEEAADLLERQSRTAAAEDRPRLLLQAAGLRLELNQTDRARQLLVDAPETLLSSEDRYRKALLEVRLLLAENQPAPAENRFKALPLPSGELRPAWLKAQADIASASEQPLIAARALVELDELLPEARREQNQHHIWAALSEIRMDELRLLMPPPPDRMGAWLELAYLARTHRLEPATLHSTLLQWQQRYPEHPANERLIAELLARDAERAPDRVALLLPLSGSLSAPANAILDGFMAAYYADTGEQPQVKVYDVGETPSRALTAYQEAVDAGSNFVVGPLTKESLIMLASIGELQAPLLALNTLPRSEQAPDGMYQFALAPEDEAIAAADYAMAQGLSRALVMVPDGEWGERVGEAFSSALQNRGGTVLETVSYNPQGTDFSAAISALLNLDASNRRGRQLRATLKRDLKTEAQRRQDVDIVFMAAFPRPARLIRPQLRFFEAIDVPVIATSHAYSGFSDPADHDLNGVQIMDMPWILHEDTNLPINRQELQQLRAEALRQPRLYAFGIDAYRLIRHLPLLRQHPADSLEGYTGELSLDSQGRVHRRLYPARFRSSTVAPVDEKRTFGFSPGDDAAW
jgi:outer membrane PBP1 activator LpoA protein